MKFTENQQNFMAFQLFVNTSQHAPSSIYCNKNFYDRCLTLTKRESNGEDILQVFEGRKDKMFNWFIDVPFLFAIMNTFLREEFPQNFLDIQQVLKIIDQRLAELPSTNSCPIVYRAQFLREEDLKIIRKNINGLITFHTYIAATKDLLTARTIARQAADRGLLLIIFHIEIPTRTFVIELDDNRLIFRFAAVFRIRSMNLAPDSIWYAQLKYANSDFQSIQERFQIQVAEQLTWLTLGKYLCVLNHFDEAKSYYEYLINVLSKDHRALLSIYNNMALIFTESGHVEQALKYYELAEKIINTISSDTDNTQERISFKSLAHSGDTLMAIDCCTLYDKMAEIYLRQFEPEQALKYYRKGLESATDPVARVQFEQKIKNILSSNQ